MASNVIGIFESTSVADEVISDLTSNGFSSSAVTRYDGSSSGLEQQLLDAGIEADDARSYASSVTKDGAVVVAQAEDDKVDDAVEIMNRYYTAADSDAQYAAGSTQAVTGSEGEQRLEVVEEQLQVGKRTVDRGGVRIKRVVSEREVEEQVALRDETIKVDRQAVNRSVSNADDLFTEKTIELTETDEEAVVSKEARVVEEVVVGKEVENRTETVRDTVRRADVEIERLGWTYGEEMTSKPEYHGLEWHEVEGKARTDWEINHQDKGTWEQAQGSIKNAWDRMRGKS